MWGTLIVPLTNGDASYGVQLTGIIAVGMFTSIVSGIIWSVLKMTMGLSIG